MYETRTPSGALMSIGRPWTPESGWHPKVPLGAQLQLFPGD